MIVSKQHAWNAAPWRATPIPIETGNKAAIRKFREINKTTDTILSTDASTRNKLAGIVVIKKIGQGFETVEKHVVGWETTCPILAAELKAIEIAVRHAAELVAQAERPVWIFTDSLHAVQAINQSEKSTVARECVRRITQLATPACVTIQWILAHRSVKGNERADIEARSMTEPGLKPTADANLRVRELKQVRKIAVHEMEKVKQPRLPS